MNCQISRDSFIDGTFQKNEESGFRGIETFFRILGVNIYNWKVESWMRNWRGRRNDEPFFLIFFQRDMAHNFGIYFSFKTRTLKLNFI